MTKILGVDPGLSGGLAIIDPARRVVLDTLKFTTIKTTLKAKTKKGNFKVQRDLELSPIALFIDRNNGGRVGHIDCAVIEDVNAFSKNGPKQAFQFGRAHGSVEGIIAAHFIRRFYTKPAVWKKALGLSPDKQLSLDLAKKLFPENANLFQLKKDADVAEAVLIAFYHAERLPQ